MPGSSSESSNSTNQSSIEQKDAQIAALQAQLNEEVASRKRLIDVSTMLNSTLNLNELLRVIMGATAELVKAESSSLLLVDEETGDLVFQIVTDDPDQAVQYQRVPVGQGFAGWVASHGEPLMTDAPTSDPRHYSGIDQLAGSETRSLLAVPLKFKNQIVGVAEAINKQGDAGFSQGDLDLAMALASQAAIAINNARLYARLTEALVVSRMSYRA
jgi:GAF domain-containing protein